MQHEHDGLELHDEWGEGRPSDPYDSQHDPGPSRFARTPEDELSAEPGSDAFADDLVSAHAPTAPPLGAHLQDIVGTAERAAEQIRTEAEARAGDRIAEANRAADYRASAAEQEAAQILADARAESERLINEAVLSVDAIYAEAQEQRQQAEQLLEQARREARESSETTVSRARDQARDIVRAAHETTDDVISEGTDVTSNLRDLSDSLRSNAERLLRDIRLAHGSMTARLDQAMPEPRPAGETSAEPRASGDAGPILDVPEFFVPEG